MCSNSGTVFTTGNSLRVAVNDYLSDKDAGLQLYGRMNCWDVSAITDMNSLFYWKSTMNEDIGCWDVSNVTNMDYMFYGASSFNQNLCNWFKSFSADTPQVYSNMFSYSGCPLKFELNFDLKGHICQKCMPLRDTLGKFVGCILSR
jgi:hypothetical protein